MHVATNRTYEYQIQIPIRLVDVPEDLVLTSDQPDDLQVMIQATGKQLISMAMADAQIDLSLLDYTRGTHEREIVAADVLSALDRPYGSFEIVIPRSIRLTLERRIEKALPVLVTNEFEPRIGFAVMSEPIVEPDSIMVSGPASVVSKLRSIPTDSMQFVDLDSPLEERIGLLLPDSLHLTTSDSSVLLQLAVEPKRTRQFDSVAVQPPRGFNLDKFKVEPETITVVLEIPGSEVDSFSVEDFEISFKRPPILRDSVRAALKTTLPDNVSIVSPLVDSVLILSRDENTGD